MQRSAMYYALSLRDVLRTKRLTFEFFDSLDEFNLVCIQKWFDETLEDQMGMLGEIEHYNYQLFEEYKDHLMQREYFADLKKAA